VVKRPEGDAARKEAVLLNPISGRPLTTQDTPLRQAPEPRSNAQNAKAFRGNLKNSIGGTATAPIFDKKNIGFKKVGCGEPNGSLIYALNNEY